MSSNLRRTSVCQNSRFYLTPTETMEEVKTGFLYKSPPASVLTKSMKSWKRRYFVLTKTSQNFYQLKYYKDENKNKVIGEINMYQISMLFLSPDTHPTWEWIQKNFRCSSSNVLYMRLPNRDYFLIGESSIEMEGWYNALFPALKLNTNNTPEERYRSISEPSEVKTSYDDHDVAELKEQPRRFSEEVQKKPSPPLLRRSAPESLYEQNSHYDYPTSYKMAKSDDEDEDDDQKINEITETETDNGVYMDMASVKMAVSETYSEDNLTTQTSKPLNGDFGSRDTFLNFNGSSGSTGLNTQIPQERESVKPEEKEICLNQEELKNNAIFSEETGKPCVSDWKHIQSPGLFHEGDQILAVNDLLTDSLAEVKTYLRRLSKDHVKLTILRQPGSRPLSGCSV